MNYENRITPDNITELKENEIFVFGSNLAGRHGAGAALLAVEKFGAIYGEGKGFMGQSFAIPTKDRQIETFPLIRIQLYIDFFVICALHSKDKIFLVTQIGCGLAGYTPKDIAPLFKDCIDLENVYLPKEFWEVLDEM
jgi:hypothetical protein